MDDGFDERTKPSRPYSKTLIEYSLASTTHGIFYIFERGRLVLERFFWLIVVVIGIMLAAVWSFWAYEKWQDDPMLTTISTTGLPIQDVPFPSITICAQGIDLLIQINNYILVYSSKLLAKYIFPNFLLNL